jgi:acyl-CoA synthetase (AMP-forming)/AMP-acid ligase II
MNDVINSQGYTQAAFWNRIPIAAWCLMAAIALCSAVLFGYRSRNDNAARTLGLVLPLVVCRATDEPRGVSPKLPDRHRRVCRVRARGVWHQGDFAEWTEHGGMIIHGRSDTTLNPQGVRIGTAEIYRQVELLPEIVESVVIGQDVSGDVRVILFVVLKPGAILDDALRERIKRQVREGASPRHVPTRIIAVGDIPRTKSGKITELAVHDVVMGREVKNKEALANPEALELFRELEELRD